MLPASRQFSYPKTKKNTSQNHAVVHPVLIWGMALLKEHNGSLDRSYQLWVVHLKGLNGKEYFDKQTKFHQRNFTQFGTRLVEFVSSQFDSMRQDEKDSIREGMLKNCELLYIASYNSCKQTDPTIVVAIQYSTSADGAFIIWLGIQEDIPESTTIDGINVVRYSSALVLVCSYRT
jgi:hypothetical protein